MPQAIGVLIDDETNDCAFVYDFGDPNALGILPLRSNTIYTDMLAVNGYTRYFWKSTTSMWMKG